MIASFFNLLAIALPHAELLIIFAFAAVLPVVFVVWIRKWLGSVKDEHPEDVLREQAKADKEHRDSATLPPAPGKAGASSHHHARA